MNFLKQKHAAALQLINDRPAESYSFEDLVKSYFMSD